MNIPDWFIPWLGVVCFAIGIGGIFFRAYHRGLRDAEEEGDVSEEEGPPFGV